jgi:hypothetical protein
VLTHYLEIVECDSGSFHVVALILQHSCTLALDIDSLLVILTATYRAHVEPKQSVEMVLVVPVQTCFAISQRSGMLQQHHYRVRPKHRLQWDAYRCVRCVYQWHISKTYHVRHQHSLFSQADNHHEHRAPTIWIIVISVNRLLVCRHVYWSPTRSLFTSLRMIWQASSNNWCLTT